MDTIDFVKSDCFDYSCHTGVTFSVDMIVYQDCVDTPNDLTGYSAQLLVFNGSESNVVVSVPGIISTPLTGAILFNISADDTALLPIGIYNHHIQMTSADNTVYRVAEGTFEINQ